MNKAKFRAVCFRRLALIVFVSVSLLGCTRTQSDAHVRRYQLKGKILSFDKGQRQVIIAHESIPGFMEAMTMPYTLNDDAPFDVMHAGDAIQATLVVDDQHTRIENPIITQSSGESRSLKSSSTSPTEPSPGVEVPDFKLVNQDSKSINLQQYRGRTLLLTFIYTRCPLPDFCTLMSTNFAQLNRELQKNPTLWSQTHLLSVSIDPAYDTPQVLRSYGAAHTENYNQEKFDHWEFATGQSEEIRRMANFFGLIYQQEGDQIVHSLRTAIITPDGKLFKLYRGNDWKPEDILHDMEIAQDGKSS